MMSDPVSLLLPAFVLAVGLWLLIRIAGRADVRWPESWIALFAAVGTFAATSLVGHYSIEHTANLEVDMLVSAGNIVEADANDLSVPPFQLAIIPNERHTYTFEHLPAVINYLRLEPTDSAQAHISIYGAAVVSAGQVVHKFGPAELQSWHLYNLAPSSGDLAAMNLVNSSPANFLAAPVSINTSQRRAIVQYLVGLFHRAGFFTLLFITYFLLVLVCGLSAPGGAIEASLVGTVIVLAYPIAALVAKWPGSPPSISQAVGNASFMGYPKSTDYMIYLALAGLCFAVAWISSRYSGAKYATELRAGDASENRSPAKALPARHAAAAATAVLVLLALLYCPNLGAVLQQVRQGTIQSTDTHNLVLWDYLTRHGSLPVRDFQRVRQGTIESIDNWDTQVFVLWDYLIKKGRLPFRDFWYTYSGLYLYHLPFPVGPLVIWASEVLLLWLLYLGMQFVIGETRISLLVFLLALLPIWLNEFQEWYRYGFAAALILFYAVLRYLDHFEWRKQAPFAVLIGLVALYEPAQVVYAGAAILVDTLFAAWPERGAWRGWNSVRASVWSVAMQRLRIIGLPALAGLTPVIVFWGIKGMLPGYIRFQLSLPVMSAYVASSTSVVDWTFPSLGPNTVFMMPFFVLVIGFYAWCRKRNRLDAVTLAMLLLGVTGYMAMQKEIVRPYILEQLQIYPYLAMLLYFVGVWRRRTRAQTIALASFVGFVLGFAQYRGGAGGMARTVAEAPKIIAGDSTMLAVERAEIRSVNAQQYEPDQIAGFTAEKAALNTLRDEYGWNSRETIYVLGDDAVFYILAGQDPPYMSNTYNGSPLNEQERVLAWLQERRPRFVLWNPSDTSFDGVPQISRLPLIYQYIAEHYRQAKAVGPYQILVPAERPAIDPEFWKRQFGSAIDLGHIPGLTGESNYRKCTGSSAESCRTVLVVRLPGATPPGQEVVSFDSAYGPFQVTFSRTAGEREYRIDVDRLWFRSYIGIRPLASTSTPTGEVIAELRQRKSGILY
ncbi:MAG TPA: hypothetical protein VIY49_21480 [Bryobacteraceae bacterium]